MESSRSKFLNERTDCGFIIGQRDADRLPYSIRILLESAIRNCDEFQVTSKDVEKIIDWENTSPKLVEIPFKPARVLLQVPFLSLTVCVILAEITIVCVKFVGEFFSHNLY